MDPSWSRQIHRKIMTENKSTLVVKTLSDQLAEAGYWEGNLHGRVFELFRNAWVTQDDGEMDEIAIAADEVLEEERGKVR